MTTTPRTRHSIDQIAALARIAAPIVVSGFSSPPPLDRRAPLMALVAFVAVFSETIVLALAPWLVWTTRTRMRERHPVFPSGFHEGIEIDAVGMMWCTAIVAAYHAGTTVGGFGLLAPCTCGHKGRRAAVIAGLCGIATGAVLFGLTERSLVWAVATRFAWGLFGVDVPLARTLMCDGYEQVNRAKALHYAGIVAGVGSSLGFIVAAWLSLPGEATHFASFPRNENLERFPFLLPCLIVALVAAAAAAAQCLFLREAWVHFRASAVSVRNKIRARASSGGGYANVGPESPSRGNGGGDAIELELAELGDDDDDGIDLGYPYGADDSDEEEERDGEMMEGTKQGSGMRNFEPLSIAAASAADDRGGGAMGARCGGASCLKRACSCAQLCHCGEGGLAMHYIVAALVSAVEITTSALFPIWAMRCVRFALLGEREGQCVEEPCVSLSLSLSLPLTLHSLPFTRLRLHTSLSAIGRGTAVALHFPLHIWVRSSRGARCLR